MKELGQLAQEAEERFVAVAFIDAEAGIADVMRRRATRRRSHAFKRTACLVALAGMLLLLGTHPAASTDPDVQRKVDEYLAAHPGGRQTGPAQVSYNEGALVITVTGRGAADCPHGSVCFYEHPNFESPMGEFHDCGWLDLSTLGWQYRINSAVFNRSYGQAQFYSLTTPLFSVGGDQRLLPDVGAENGSVANRVYVFC